MSYGLSERVLLERRFRKYFNMEFRPFCDVVTSVVSRHFVLDVVKFDTWLHYRCGDYEDNGMSMRDCIMANFGSDAVRLIEALMD